MSKNKKTGDKGEIEVCEKVVCPNCSKKLIRLPINYPLFDVQCTGCAFRAQVKTNKHAPSAVIRGAGWDIIEKVMKSGFIVPSLIANFKWERKGHKFQEIRFYPFVAKRNLSKYQLSSTARRANYRMFNYIDLHNLPYFVADAKGRWVSGKKA